VRPARPRLSRGDALALLRVGGEDEAAASWPCAIGPFTLRFPNFAWRRRALAAHDLHHLMTGYPMTMRGEFQLAAWEFGAGRYPHWGATFFCGPLILLGLLWSPPAMWRAFRSGRRSESLYAMLEGRGGVDAGRCGSLADRPIGPGEAIR
jgi:hypothetical protein